MKSSATYKKKELFVIGIGASAGGLEPIQNFFTNMSLSKNADLAFVVIQHLSPDFNSLMDQLLSRNTKLRILTVTNNLKIEKNTIYLIPPKSNIIVKDGHFTVTEQVRGHYLNLPINIFFKSLAHEYGNRAIGIIMSGTGSDGSEGIIEIKKNNGFVLVEEPQSAAFDGMPKTAIATGEVDLIVSNHQMPSVIIEYLKSPEKFQPIDNLLVIPENFTGLKKINSLILQKYKLDLSCYKSTTKLRRIQRRLESRAFDNIKDYAENLENDPDELKELFDDIIIGVTSFFRDPESYDILYEKVIPDLYKRVEGTGRDIRIWIPGCSTGQEVYSTAILFHEYAEDKKIPFDVRIFATDIQKNYLDKATTGIYTKEEAEGLSPDRKKRYFKEIGRKYQIIKEIRNIIVFSQHNLITDPPFTKLDFISCKNLLIYINPKVQKKIVSVFKFGLNVPGYLVLGPSETVNNETLTLEVIDHKWKIFKKNKNFERKSLIREINTNVSSNTVSRYSEKILNVTPDNNVLKENINGFIGANNNSTPPKSLPLFAYHSALKATVKCGFLIDDNYSIIHVFGDASRFLDIGEGMLKSDLRELVIPKLKPVIRTGLIKASKLKENIIIENVIVNDENAKTEIKKDITVQPILSEYSEVTHFIIKITDTDKKDPVRAISVKEIDNYSQTIISELELELQKTKESLQTTVEEVETSNEELQSTNEELLASNEELQSTNEELHSVNEELYTVNAEHQKKIEELKELNADFNNLMKSIDIGVVFVDTLLCIRFFNSTAKKLFKFDDNDIYRSIEKFSYDIDFKFLIPKLREVIKSGNPFSEEISNSKNCWYLLKIFPYITANGAIQGGIISFVDINDQKKTLLELGEKSEKLSQAVDIAEIGVWEWELKDSNFEWNDNMFDLFGQNKKSYVPTLSSVKKSFSAEFLKEIRKQIKLAFKKSKTVKVQGVISKPDGSRVYVNIHGKIITNSITSKPEKMIGVCFDISEQKRQEEKFYNVFNNLPVAAILIDKKGDTQLANPATLKLFKLDGEEIEAASIFSFLNNLKLKKELLSKISRSNSNLFIKSENILLTPSNLNKAIECEITFPQVKFLNSISILCVIIDKTELNHLKKENKDQAVKIVDITQKHKEAEQKLLENIKDKRIALSNLYSSVLFLDDKLCIRKFVGDIQKYLSLRASDIGRPFEELDEFKIKEEISKRSNNKCNIIKEIKLSTDEWIKINISKNIHDTGDFGYIVTFMDITEYKQKIINAEKELERLSESLDFNNVGTFEYCFETKSFIMDKGGRNILGIKKNRNTFKEDEIVNLVFPGDKLKTLEILEHDIKDNRYEKFTEIIRTDDMPRTLLSRGYYTEKYIRGVFIDITDRLKEDNRLLGKGTSNIISDFTIDDVSSGWFSWRLISDDFYISPKFKDALGYLDYEIPNSVEGYKSLILIDERAKLNKVFDEFKQINHTATKELNIRYLDKNKEIRWFMLEISNCLSPQRKTEGIVGLHFDITKMKVLEEKLKEQNNFDTLSGLYSRSNFSKHLPKAITRKEDGYYNVALMFIDIDGFKGINDTYGHRVGDLLIMHFGKTLKNLSRKNDFTARLSGDEFGVVIEDYRNAKDLYDIAERYLNIIREPIDIEEIKLNITVSIGIAICNSPEMTTEELLKRADIAMYKAKTKGKNSYEFFDDKLASEVFRRNRIELAQRQAIDNSELHVVYQPIYNKIEQIVGAEVLLRWDKEGFTDVTSDEFIKIAENNGQIISIGNWVLNTAFSDYAELTKKYNLQDFHLAVNISAVQLFSDNFLNDVKKAIDKKFDTLPKIVFEITETHILDNIDKAKQIMEKVKELNIEFSLDDFGTGYSSLLTLSKLPVSVVKIDKSFIQNISKPKTDSRNIIKSILSLTSDLKMKIVAEGVETAKQLDFMIKNNADYIQGYYYSKPISLEQLKKKLTKKTGNK